jgi:amidase
MASNNELWREDGVTLARMIRAREVSCREVVASALGRLEAVNPALNAVVRALPGEALAEADAADQALKRGETVGPLHGVPVTTKVNLDQRGLPTDNGIVEFRSLVADRDNPTIANLRRAGAIVIGRTNTPGFSMRWFTDNALHGLTYNPWHRGRNCGGSSGGAASAVSAGIGAIAQGNDIAGSVRYPAYCCGVVGLRPTYGRIPAHNFTSTSKRPISSQLMAVQGPLTRRVADARVAFAAMAAGDPNDPRWVDVPLEGPVPGKPIRVALVPDPGGRGGVDPAITAALQQAARWLGEAGYAVEEVSPPEFGQAIDLWAKLAMDDVIAALEPFVAKYGDAAIKTALGYWRALHPPAGHARVLEAMGERDALLRLWQLFLEDHPLILMPTSNEPPFAVGRDVVSAAETWILMKAQATQLAIPVLGLPSVSVPTGVVPVAGGQIPVGVQIVAGRYREDLCLAAAEAIEARAAMKTPVDPVAA